MLTNREPAQEVNRSLPTVDIIDPEASNGQSQNTVYARFRNLYSVFIRSDIRPHLKVVAGTIAGSTIGSITIGLAGTIAIVALSASAIAFVSAVDDSNEEYDISYVAKITASLGALSGALVGGMIGGRVGFSKVSSDLNHENDVIQYAPVTAPSCSSRGPDQ